MEKLLILNPGSTSTKIAVFEDETPLFTESITHTPEELAAFDCVADQYEFRRDLVIATLKKHGVALESLTGIVSRGGLLPPIEAGAYEVNDDMVWQLKNKPQNEHASNVGAMIARALSKQYGIPAFIYDGITVVNCCPSTRSPACPGMAPKGAWPQPEHPRRGPALRPGERKGLCGRHRHRGPFGRRHLRQSPSQRQDRGFYQRRRGALLPGACRGAAHVRRDQAVFHRRV